jgi:hypothetical protein
MENAEWKIEDSDSDYLAPRRNDAKFGIDSFLTLRFFVLTGVNLSFECYRSPENLHENPAVG